MTSSDFTDVAQSSPWQVTNFRESIVRGILYAVGIAPAKLDLAVALRRRKVDLSIVVDNMDQARTVAAKYREIGMTFPTLIEIDA